MKKGFWRRISGLLLSRQAVYIKDSVSCFDFNQTIKSLFYCDIDSSLYCAAARFILVFNARRISHSSSRQGYRGRKNMKKALAMVMVVAIYGILVVATNEVRGTTVDERSSRCCDSTWNCTVGNGVCNCPASRIIDPNGLGYCYSCNGTSCIADT